MSRYIPLEIPHTRQSYIYTLSSGLPWLLSIPWEYAVTYRMKTTHQDFPVLGCDLSWIGCTVSVTQFLYLELVFCRFWVYGMKWHTLDFINTTMFAKWLNKHMLSIVTFPSGNVKHYLKQWNYHNWKNTDAL